MMRSPQSTAERGAGSEAHGTRLANPITCLVAALVMFCTVAAADPVTGIYDNFNDNDTNGWSPHPIIANYIDTGAKPTVINGRLYQSTLTPYRSDWMIQTNDYIGGPGLDVAFRGRGSIRPWGGIAVHLLAPEWPGNGTHSFGYAIELYGERDPRMLQIVRLDGPFAGTLVSRYLLGADALVDHDYRIERRSGAWRAWKDGQELASSYSNFDDTYSSFPYVGVAVGARPGGFDWIEVKAAGAPEPSTMVLLLLGAAGMAVRRRKRTQR